MGKRVGLLFSVCSLSSIKNIACLVDGGGVVKRKISNVNFYYSGVDLIWMSNWNDVVVPKWLAAAKFSLTQLYFGGQLDLIQFLAKKLMALSSWLDCNRIVLPMPTGPAPIRSSNNSGSSGKFISKCNVIKEIK